MEAKQIRQKARENLAPNWWLSIGVAAVAALLGGLLLGSSFLPNLEASVGTHIFGSWNWEIIEGFRVSISNGILGFAAFIIGGVLQLGYAQFLLKQHDGRDPQFNDLFSQFDRFGTGFAQSFLRTLYTVLWSLLLVVPGIIAALSYAMTPFILAEHPDLTASEAISRSKELMNGHKTDLFVLYLTFIGWDLLCVLTLNLGNLVLNPYKNAAITVFYRDITAQKRYEM